MTTDMLYVSRLKVELDQRMRDSQFFIEAEKEDEIKRYLDKYSIIKREKLDIGQCHISLFKVYFYFRYIPDAV